MHLWKKALFYAESTPIHREFESMALNPRSAQLKFLESVLKKNRNTSFGRDHGFHEIRTPSEYAKRVPKRDYEGLRPYMNRMIEGEKNVLTDDTPFIFMATSGTTSAPKLLPLTPTGERLMARGYRHLVHGILSSQPSAFDWGQVIITSKEIEGYTKSGIPFGSASGRIIGRVPRYFRSQFVVPTGVTLVEDYDTRYLIALRFAIENKVSGILTANPSTLTRLAEMAKSKSEVLIRAIHDGQLGCNTDSSETKALAGLLRPNPKRARELELSALKPGGFIPLNYWPELRMVSCWTGGSVGTQLKMIPNFYGHNVAIRDIGYIASEGRFSSPVLDYSSTHQSAGPLSLTQAFFEFISEDDIESEKPPILLVDELEVGKKYLILVTTVNGLYRYDMNDIIEVVGLHHRTPMISFVRKGQDMTNITGEKMHLNHCMQALKDASTAVGVDIRHYRVVANVPNSQYEIFVELPDGVSDKQALEVLKTIDSMLSKLNVEYGSKRGSKRLKMPVLHTMQPNWADEMKRLWVKNGGRDVQFKWKYLVPELNREDQKFVLKSFEQS